MNKSLKYVISFFALCCLIASSALKSQTNQAADSLFAALDTNPEDTTAYAQLDKIVNGLFHKNVDLAMTIALKMERYASRSKNYSATAQVLLNIGILNDLKGEYGAALLKYDEALKIAEASHLIKLQGDIYNNFSITNAVLGNIDESVSFALKALSIFESMNDSSRMARIYNNLGSRNSEMGYYDEALKYYQKAASINQAANDTKKLAFNYGNIGLLYYEMNQKDKSLEFFRKSILLQDTVNDKYNYSIALHYLALAYQRLSQCEMALKYEKHSYEIACICEDELGKITSLNGLAVIHKEMGQPKEGLKYYLRSEAIAEKIGARYYLINIFEGIAGIYAQLNDFQKAFEYNQKYAALKDSIMTTEKDKAVNKIKEFENEKKQQQIQLLTKDSEIQKLSIKRQKILRNAVSAVGILILILAIVLLQRYRYVRKTRNELSEKNKIINREKERSDELLLNILPAETAEELKNNGRSYARQFEMVTVMFTDFKGFTFMAENLSPQELVDEIDHCFRHFDQIISKYGIEKIKTIGDAYMCAGGLPIANHTNPADVVKAGLEMQKFMQELNIQKEAENKPHLDLRIGIHTGPVVAGIVGTKKFQYDIWGDTVNIASRMESSGEIGKVNISQTTFEKVNHYFKCEHRGKIEAKNKGLIDMYFVEASDEFSD